MEEDVIHLNISCQTLRERGLFEFLYSTGGLQEDYFNPKLKKGAVEGQKHVPIESRYFSGFFCFIGTSSCPDCRKGQEHSPTMYSS
ncbi:hypothetical protein [Paenibacillus uliginis]|uniref:hypothetical protein n=1 Tax=Paenibacillus uliginis TaxID=683737 RepID=UPI001FCD363E|nr:hypothetical protein [Paenibacillus uliginis]